MDHGQHSPQYAGALKHHAAPLNIIVQLTKPGIIFGNLASLSGGYFLASDASLESPSNLLAVLVGTALVIGCGCVLNNCIDRDIDRRMVRTCHRALAIRAISLKAAVCYAIVLGIAGFALLWTASNLLAFTLALNGLVIYAGLYSGWLKRHSEWGTLVGSLSGAMPPVIGYCAVSGKFDLIAALLVVVFCLWQMPHSHAISVMRRDDFRAAGLPLLTFSAARRQIIVYMLGFVLSATVLGVAADLNVVYFGVVLGLGGYWCALAFRIPSTADRRQWARSIFTFSIILILALNLAMSLGSVLVRPLAGPGHQQPALGQAQTWLSPPRK
nr:heme o synthase [uncultured Pseudomonas sp.]